MLRASLTFLIAIPLLAGNSRARSILPEGVPLSGRIESSFPSAPASQAPEDPSIEFLTGPIAQSRMDAVTNATVDWRNLQGCNERPGGAYKICTLGQIMPITDGITATITSNNKDGLFESRVTPDGYLQATGTEVYIHFSSPVSAAGLELKDGYRFNWTVGLEAFDVNGNSLGKAEESGIAQGANSPPLVFSSAIASEDLISSLRLYTMTSNAVSSLMIGPLQVSEAPEPSTLAMGATGLVLLVVGKRKYGRFSHSNCVHKLELLNYPEGTYRCTLCGDLFPSSKVN